MKNELLINTCNTLKKSYLVWILRESLEDVIIRLSST